VKPTEPTAPLTICRRCNRIATRGLFCDVHAVRRKDDRGTSAQRGYDRRWRVFRAHFLRRHPMCADCVDAAAQEVHHIQKVADAPELRLLESNCLALCKVCHSKRTARGE